MRIKVFIPIREDDAFRILNQVSGADGVPLWRSKLRKLSKVFDLFVDAETDMLVDSIESDDVLSGVTVYQRDSSLSDTNASTNQLILDFLDRYRVQHEVIIQTHINHPFLRITSICDALPLLKIDGSFDSVVAANRFQSRLWSSDAHGHFPINHNPMDLRRSFELPQFWLENSAFYIFSAAKFRALGNRVGLKPFFFEIPDAEGLAIHSFEDWDQWVQISDEIQTFNKPPSFISESFYSKS